MTKEEIIRRLKSGNLNFINNKLSGKNQDSKRRLSQVQGQSPMAVIISCADSRVVPELIFDTGIGELFVIRVAGNIANISTIASAEYAVAHLDTKVIIVLSHESCGAVNAAVGKNTESDNLIHLLKHISPAIKQAEEGDSVNDISKINAVQTAKDLSNNSEIINSAVSEKGLEIIPAYYKLESGEVEFI